MFRSPRRWRLGAFTLALAVGLTMTVAGVAGPAAAATPGAGTYENTSAAMVYSGTGWSNLTSSSSSGGSVSMSSKTGSVSFTFSGTKVKWLSWKSANSGINDVYIDGVKKSSVDRYASATTYKYVAYESPVLTDGQHTIKLVFTGAKNASAGSNNLLLDAFIVLGAESTSASTSMDVTATGSGSGVQLTWTPSSDATATGYNIYRAKGSGTTQTKLTPTPTTDLSFNDIGLTPGETYHYFVSVVTPGGESIGRSTADADVTDPVPDTSDYRYANCPAATVTVTTREQLRSALATVSPGDTIRIADGVYQLNFVVNQSGTEGAPIWICGSKNAIIDPGSYNTGGTALKVQSVSNVVITGFTIRNAFQGVMVKDSTRLAITDLTVTNIGQEAIHLYDFTTDSLVGHNTIRSTGLNSVSYGEGVYIGTSERRWVDVTGGEPDASDGNMVIGNSISLTGAESIEAKEGTSDGLIADNVISTFQSGSNALGWVLVTGNDWLVIGNQGTNARDDAYESRVFIGDSSEGSWGTGNQWVANTGNANSAGYGVWVQTNAGVFPPGTIVACDNVVTGASSGQTNLTCQK